MSDITREEQNRYYLDFVRQCVEKIQYGTVNITIQDGRIIQVEENERHRLKLKN